MEKRYGLPVAIAMVVGTVIGSGVFFKAETVLKATGGNMMIGILSWLVTGIVMIICTYTFGIVAGRHEGVDSLVGYTKAYCGKNYAYYVGWFMSTIYYPALVSVLSWLPARYVGVLIGGDSWGPASTNVMVLSLAFMSITYAMNALAPKLAGKFQMSTTALKLIPLLLMAVLGTVVGLSNGQLVENFTVIVNPDVMPVTGLFAGVVSLSFAYEGWICATAIDSELEDSKRNLPRALIIGALIVVAVYVVYYIGLAGALETSVMMENGQAGAKLAFQNIFGNVGGVLIFVFVVVSCWGTCNGLTVSCSRGMYELGHAGDYPALEMFNNVDSSTGMPTNASVVGLLTSALWLVYFFGANLTDPWFGPFSFDSSELPIITLYAMYIPIFLKMMKDKELPTSKRIVMPALAILCCLFMCYSCVYTYGMKVVYYVIVFAVIMLLGAFLKTKKKKA